MKKVFQIKLKNITRVFALVVAASLVTFTGCKSYDEDITGLQGQIDKVVTDVAGLKTSVAALQTSVSGMTYIKSITMGTDGKLTITPSTGAAIVYDAKTYVTYDIALTNNVLTVNGVNKGTVAIPALTFADGVLKSGTSTVADLTSWLKSGLTVVDGMLAINGQKTSVAISVPAGKSVKDVTLVGNNVTVSYTDGSASTTFVNDAPIVATTGANGNLFVNGVDTGVMVKNTFAVSADGFLTVNGVKTTVAIPAENKSTIIINKDGSGAVVSATVGDGKDSFTVKVNPTNELLSGLLFVPETIEAGVSVIDYGYLTAADASKALYQTLALNFRFNPSSADLSRVTEWNFVTNSATFRAPSATTPGDVTGVFAVPTLQDMSGYGVFTLKAVTDPFVGVDATNAQLGTKKRIITLQAKSKDFYNNDKNAVVTSDIIKVQPVAYKAFISKIGVSPFTTWPAAKPAVNDNPANDIEIIYDGIVTPLPKVDLDDLVFATGGTGVLPTDMLETLKFGKLDVDYYFTYSISDDFLGLDLITNQNSFVTLNTTTNELTVKAGTASIDRKPLVTVQLKAKSTGKVLATAYIKFSIVRKSATQTQKTVTYNLDPVTYQYPELFTDAVAGINGDGKEIVVTWDNMNDQVYNPMGYKHDEYQADYHINPTTINVNGTAVAGATYTMYKDLLTTSTKAPKVDTYAMKYLVTPATKFGTTTVEYIWDPKVATPTSTEPIVKIKFTVNVVKPTLDKTILAGYRLNGSDKDILTQGMNAGGAGNYKMQLYLGEAFTFGTPAYRNMFGTAANKIDASLSNHTFAFKTTVPAQTGAQLTPAAGGTIDQAFGTTTATTSGQLMDLTTKLITAKRVYDMQLITTYPNAETDVFDFKVHFVNPFTIELASPADFQLIDKVNGAEDTEDIMDNYIVYFKGKKIVTKGIAETTNSATTVVATDFVDITLPANGIFYELTPGNQYFTISKANGNAYNKFSMLTWDNSGTELQSEQPVATVKVKFVAPFAEYTKPAADNVTVKPE